MLLMVRYHTAAVQDACLLAMTRLALDCSDAITGDDIVNSAQTLMIGAGKHIRRVAFN
jgi:hypothetical protein